MARILVIDDDEQVRSLLEKVIALAGYDVVSAADGVVGLQENERTPFDIVITDIIMPEKEGIELIMELKRDYPDVRVIAISGGGRFSPFSYLQTAKKLGADFTFEKPVDLEDLLSAIGDLAHAEAS